MAIDPLPVSCQHAGHAAQDMGGKRGHMHPGQDQKPGVVSHQGDIFFAGLWRPADEAVPATDVSRGRGPTQAGNGAIVGVDDVFELLAHGMAVAQVMKLLDQAVKSFSSSLFRTWRNSRGFRSQSPAWTGV